MKDKMMEVDFEVRDYECDLQGIVNNSVYQSYLEHARHKFLDACGVNFAELSAEGVNLVVIRAELDYLGSLRPNDTFVVTCKTERVSRLKFAFIQEITKKGESRPCLKGRIYGVALNKKGRPFVAPVLDLICPEMV